MMTKEDLLKIYQENSKVLIKFGASWCGPCKAMEPVLKEIEEARPDVKVIELDVDSEEEMVQLFRVRSVPTIFWIKDGVTIDKYVGGASKEQLLSMMR